jgi:acyl-CoA thioester hydrolase
VPDFPHRLQERVRFNDCDPMGHANNAVYSTYLEQARLALVGTLAPFILARVEIDFRAQLHAGDDIEVLTRCSRIGTKSFELEHQIWRGDVLAAEAKSVLVRFDYDTRASLPLSDEQKRSLVA